MAPASSYPPSFPLAYKSYSKALELLCDAKRDKTGNALREQDEWMWGELRRNLRERGCINHEELVKLMTWKLNRGKFRPTLLSQVSSNPPDRIQTASKTAFEHLKKLSPDKKDILSAVLTLTDKLKGVGPATASAILAAYDPSIPFMSDESLSLIYPPTKLQYSISAYRNLLSELERKANELNERGEGPEEGEMWSAGSCERTVWAWSVCKRYGVEVEKDVGEGDVKTEKQSRVGVEDVEDKAENAKGKRKRKADDDEHDEKDKPTVLRRSARLKTK